MNPGCGPRPRLRPCVPAPGAARPRLRSGLAEGGSEQGQPTENKQRATDRNHRQKGIAAGGGHVETATEENLGDHKTPPGDAYGGARPARRDAGQ